MLSHYNYLASFRSKTPSPGRRLQNLQENKLNNEKKMWMAAYADVVKLQEKNPFLGVSDLHANVTLLTVFSVHCFVFVGNYEDTENKDICMKLD